MVWYGIVHRRHVLLTRHAVHVALFAPSSQVKVEGGGALAARAKSNYRTYLVVVVIFRLLHSINALSCSNLSVVLRIFVSFFIPSTISALLSPTPYVRVYTFYFSCLRPAVTYIQHAQYRYWYKKPNVNRGKIIYRHEEIDMKTSIYRIEDMKG